MMSSAETNALDENVTNALDKRAGFDDTLASNITVTGNTVFRADVVFEPGSGLVVDEAATVELNLGNSSEMNVTGDLNIATRGNLTVQGALEVDNGFLHMTGGSATVESGVDFY